MPNAYTQNYKYARPIRVVFAVETIIRMERFPVRCVMWRRRCNNAPYAFLIIKRPNVLDTRKSLRCLQANGYVRDPAEEGEGLLCVAERAHKEQSHCVQYISTLYMYIGGCTYTRICVYRVIRKKIYHINIKNREKYMWCESFLIL